MSDQPTLGDFDDISEDTDCVNPFDPHRGEPTTFPEECIVFSVSGQWGHFKRVDGNLVKETYRIPPRTTVAGLVAAILGIDRNGYYDLFARGRSAVAVEPTTDLRTVNVPMNAMSTADPKNGTWKKTVNTYGSGPKVIFTDSEINRQQHNYEVLADPAYRIYLWLENETRLDELDDLLRAGKSHYTPSLGLSEYLASIQYVGRFDVQSVDETAPVDVASAVPDGPNRAAVTPNTTYRMERSPGYMSLTKGTSGFTRRQTDEFIDYSYTLDGTSVRVTDTHDVVQVNDRNVIFR